MRLSNYLACEKLAASYRDFLYLGNQDICPWQMNNITTDRAGVKILEEQKSKYNAIVSPARIEPKCGRKANILEIPWKMGDFYGGICRIKGLPDDPKPTTVRLMSTITVPADEALRAAYFGGKDIGFEWMYRDDTIERHWFEVDTFPAKNGTAILPYVADNSFSPLCLEIEFSEDIKRPSLYCVEVGRGQMTETLRRSVRKYHTYVEKEADTRTLKAAYLVYASKGAPESGSRDP